MRGRPPKNPNHPLYRLFAERGIDKDAFAEAIGIHRRYLDLILSGKRKPGSTLALKIGKLLGMTMEEIIFPKVKEEKGKTEKEGPRQKRSAKA